MNTDIPFKLLANCFPVKGANRSVICDTQRQKLHFIPNILYDILVRFDGRRLVDIYEHYGTENSDAINEYFIFLLAHELVFFTNSPESFPDIQLSFDEPGEISNAIIDVEQHLPALPWGKIADNLNELGCSHLQIRSFDIGTLAFYYDILKAFDKSRILSIDLILKYGEHFNDDNLLLLCENFPRIVGVYLHAAPQKRIGIDHRIVYLQEQVTGPIHCGNISPEYFAINIVMYSEAQKFNTCLNKKVSIDGIGNIKNCPSLVKDYGNIYSTTLMAAVDHPDFKSLWLVSKNRVHVCRDCEFRYVCTDCRAYIDNPDDLLSKPLKCGYNPYTSKWNDWERNKQILKF